MVEVPVEEMVKTSESIREVFEPISSNLRVELQHALRRVAYHGYFKAKVEGATYRIAAWQAQVSLKTTIGLLLIKSTLLNNKRTSLITQQQWPSYHLNCNN